MSGFECDAHFAVRFESADAGAMPGPRIDNDERPARHIELDARRRNDSHQAVDDRPLERPAVDEKLHLVIQHVWGGLGPMLAILVSALAHYVPDQKAALRGIDHIF